MAGNLLYFGDNLKALREHVGGKAALFTARLDREICERP